MTAAETTTCRPPPAHGGKRRRILHAFLQVLTVAAVAWFIVGHVRRHWPALAERDWGKGWAGMGLAVLFDTTRERLICRILWTFRGLWRRGVFTQRNGGAGRINVRGRA